jgi:elongation factor G
MGKFQSSDMRNVCFVGHGDSGKTTLADALLFKAGAVHRKGSVREKTSVFDFEEVEKDKQHSIESAIAHCEWEGKLLNVIDSPGYPDYIGDAVGAMAAADTVVVCVNAHHGPQVNTRRVWELAGRLSKARMLVVTKCDAHDLEFGALYDTIRETFGARCIPVNLPFGFGPSFRSTLDVLHEKGGSDPKSKDVWSQFVETAVESDDDVMAAYLDGKPLSDDTLRDVFTQAVLKGIVVPMLFVSTEKDLGVTDLLNAIVRLAPSPLAPVERLTYADAAGHTDPKPLAADPAAPLYAQVFKLHIDKHVGKIAYLRIFSGTLKQGDTVHAARAHKKEKVGHLVIPMGKDLSPAETAGPGAIVAVTKIEMLTIGETVTSEEKPRFLAPIPFPKPMAQVAVRPKSRADETKISESLHKLADECATFTTHRDPSTHELIASGMSQLHLDTMFKRCKDRFGIEVETSPARIPYRECVTIKADGHHRHKKQTGGRGQFGEVFLRVSPAAPGEGLRYEWDVVGGTIPSNFRPAIEKGIVEKMAHGVIAGYPMPDILVSVYEGKYHDVDSSEAAFKIAGGRAFSDAVKKARPVLMEPMVEAEIVVPSEHMGDITGDLNARRGHIIGMESSGIFQVIKARVPRAEMAEYARVLTSLTSGEGSFSLHEIGYEIVPGHIQGQIIAAFKPKEEEE